MLSLFLRQVPGAGALLDSVRAADDVQLALATGGWWQTAEIKLRHAGLDPDGREAMLSLLSSLANRHGKSLLLSTHLLGDIDRVCSQVVIVDGGQVRGVGRISDLRSEYRGRFRLRWNGSSHEYLKALQESGVTVAVNGRPDEAVAEAPDGWPVRRFFEIADRCNLTLREVHPQEEDLEAVYHRLIQASEDGRQKSEIGVRKSDDAAIR